MGISTEEDITSVRDATQSIAIDAVVTKGEEIPSNDVDDEGDECDRKRLVNAPGPSRSFARDRLGLPSLECRRRAVIEGPADPVEVGR
jgi:hypothetical protein